MADRRPSRGSGPRGTRRPSGPRGAQPRAGAVGGAAASPRQSNRPAANRPTSNRLTSNRPAPRRPRERPRFTGRAAILVLVLAVLAVSFASSMRAYLQQQQHIADLKTQIDKKGVQIEHLEREKRRWNDDSYVEDQARARFGYIKPGETGYMVIDENGHPIDSPDQLTDAGDLPEEKPEAWWDSAWASMEAAGFPNRNKPDQPVDKITPPKSDD